MIRDIVLLRRACAAATALAVAAGLTACASGPSDDPAVVGDLRERVAAVSEAAAAEDWQAAAAGLDEVMARADAAAVSGTLTDTRRDSIVAAAAIVAADVDAHLATAEAERVAAETAAAEKLAAEQAAAVQAAEERAAAAEAERIAAEQKAAEEKADNSGPGNSDKGKENGKGPKP